MLVKGVALIKCHAQAENRNSQSAWVYNSNIEDVYMVNIFHGVQFFIDFVGYYSQKLLNYMPYSRNVW